MSLTDDQISAWLYGGLDADSAARIGAMIAADPELSARTERMLRLDDTVRQVFPLQEALPAELLVRLGLSDQALSAQVVDLAVARAARTGLQVPMPVKRTRTWSRGRMAAAQIATVFAIGFVVVLGTNVPRTSAVDAPYRVLGDTRSDVGANALVMFGADTDAAEVQKIAGQFGARVIGRPTAAGAWRLHVPLARRDAVLGRLRSLPGVHLAEAIEGDRP